MTVIEYDYRAILGRRNGLDAESNRKRYQVSYEIITYDRLLDYAKHCDEAKAEWE